MLAIEAETASDKDYFSTHVDVMHHITDPLLGNENILIPDSTLCYIPGIWLRRFQPFA